MSAMIKKRKLSSYLYEDLSVLSTVRDIVDGTINLKPIRRKGKLFNDDGKLIYTISSSAKKLYDVGKFITPRLENIRNITIGLDASSSYTKCLAKGNSRYVVIKPYIVCAEGTNGQFIIDGYENRVKFLVLISDKMNVRNLPSKNLKSENIVCSHFRLQSKLDNILHHIKEGKMFADLLEKIVEMAIELGYRYNPNNPEESLIIYKDGSILSNSEYKLSHALDRNNFKGIEDFFRLYSIIKKAANHGIPIVGIVKDSQMNLLSQLFSPKKADYFILNNLAKKQQITYSYLPPIKKTIEPLKNINISNYFCFIENLISPLRIEMISDFLPNGVKDFDELCDIALSNIHNNKIVHDFKGISYKLPYSILKSDIQSRYFIKDLKNYVNESLEALRRRLSVPFKIIVGFD